MFTCAIIAVSGAVAARRDAATTNNALARPILFDTFESEDGAVWTVNNSAEGTFRAIDGDYIAMGSDDGEPQQVMASDIRDIVFDDVSVQARAKVDGSGTVGVLVRRNGEMLLNGYGGGISHDGDVVLFRTDGDVRDPSTPLTVLAARNSMGFNSRDECFLRLDAIEDSLSLTVWPVDQDMPREPTLTAFDATYRRGVVGVGFKESPFGGDARGIFRDFSAASRTSAIRCAEMLCE